jgi:hypothetical protein
MRSLAWAAASKLHSFFSPPLQFSSQRVPPFPSAVHQPSLMLSWCCSMFSHRSAPASLDAPAPEAWEQGCRALAWAAAPKKRSPPLQLADFTQQPFVPPTPSAEQPRLLLIDFLQRAQVPLACMGHTAQLWRRACAASWARSTRVPPPPSPPPLPCDRSTPLAPLQLRLDWRFLPLFKLWGRFGMSPSAPPQHSLSLSLGAKLQVMQWTSPLHRTPLLPPLSLVPADGLLFSSWTPALQLYRWSQHGGACATLGAASCMTAPEPPSKQHLLEPTVPSVLHLPDAKPNRWWTAIPAMLLLARLISAVFSGRVRASMVTGMHQWGLLTALALLSGTATASPQDELASAGAIWLELTAAVAVALTATEGLQRVVQRAQDLLCSRQPPATPIPPGLQVCEASSPQSRARATPSSLASEPSRNASKARQPSRLSAIRRSHGATKPRMQPSPSTARQ